jgi:hypothetical protein
MQAYRISGLAELFLQHCQVPNLTPNQHLRALTKELATSTTTATTTPKGRQLIKFLRKQLDNMLKPVAIAPEQRVTRAASKQRVTANAATPIVPAPTVPLQRVTNAPAIMNTRDPAAKCNQILTKWTHWRQTRNNTPVDVPPITHQLINIVPDNAPWQLSRLGIVPMPTNPDAPAKSSKCGKALPASPLVSFLPLPGCAKTHIISKQALAAMVKREAASPTAAFSPQCHTFVDTIPNYAHHASPVVHLVTGKHIMSYKRLMNDPAMAKMWQTAFRKDLVAWHWGTTRPGKREQIQSLS